MVSREVAARILRIAADLDYKRNPMALGLKTRRSYTVAIIVPDLTNPIFPPIVRAVEKTLSKEGYVTVIADADNDRDAERAILDSLRMRHIDGLVLATAWLQDDIVHQCLEQKIPLVLVNRTVASDSVSSVVTNDLYGIRMTVDHLLNLGHRKLAFVGGPMNTSTGKARHDGFVDALKAYRVKLDKQAIVHCSAFTAQAGFAGALEVLHRKRGFTAIVAANDMLALGCYDALAQQGLRCPKDISITGYNDMPFADHFAPPLTTMHIPLEEIGVQAGSLLLRKMRDPDTAVPSVQLEPSLTVRGSTARPAK